MPSKKKKKKKRALNCDTLSNQRGDLFILKGVFADDAGSFNCEGRRQILRADASILFCSTELLCKYTQVNMHAFFNPYAIMNTKYLSIAAVTV